MTKILIKRGTYTQWNSSTTPLAIGELGLDTTNGILKVGNGTSLWGSLSSFVLSSDLSNSLGDYVPIGDVGNPDGVASLDSTGNVPISQLGNIISGAPAVLDTLNELAAALNNDQNFTNTVNTALSGKVSKSGGSTIIPSSGSVAGLSFTPATGQTANLLEFVGGPTGGGVRVGPGGNIFEAPGIESSYYFTASAGGSSVVPVTIKGVSGQSANLTEWKNSSGTALTRIDAYGNIASDVNLNVYGYIGLGIAAVSTARTIIGSNNSSMVGLIVKGASSQTGDLQQWQNNSGTALTKIDSSGNLYFINPTANNNGNDTPSPSINFQGNLWNSAGGNVNMKGAIKVAAYSANTNPTISKMSFLLATDNGTPSEVASFTNTGAFSNIGGLDSYGSGVIFRLRNTTSATPDIVTPSPKLELMGRAWNSDQGSAPSRAYLQVNANNNNTNPFINRLGFFVATGNNDGGWNYGTDATEYMSILGNGRVGINSNSPSATLDIRSISFSTTGLIVRGAASQSANLQEWQNSAGTVLVKIDSYGQIFSYSGLYANGGGGIGAALVAQPGSASLPAIVAKGATSQSANLQEWQNSSGTVLSKLDAGGSLSILNGNGANSSSSISNMTGRLIFDATYNDSPRGPNKIQMYNDNGGWIGGFGIHAGTVSYYSGADHKFYRSNNQTSFTETFAIFSTGAAFVTLNSASAVGLIVKGASSQSANLQEWQNSSGTVLASISPLGAIQTTTQMYSNRYYYSTNGTASGTSISFIDGSGGGGLSIRNIDLVTPNSAYDNITPLTISGNINQTADLQRWSNASGTVLSRVSSTGVIKANSGLVVENSYSANWTALQVGSTVAAGNVIIVAGASGQTADLQQWNNSAGTVLAKVDSNGVTTLAAVRTQYYQPIGGGGPFLGMVGGYPVTAYTSGPTVVPFAIQGASSQTADLQQWQDSNGNILTRINSNGMLGINTSVLSGTLSSRGTLSIIPTTSGDTAITIKAASGQGVNLFEVQNSSSSVITRISSTGGFLTNGQLQVNNIYGGGSASAFIWAGSASMVPIKIVGAASQTANLQEWQNSSNTVLASIDSSGSMFTTTASAGTNTTQVATTAFVKTAVDNSNLNIYITDSGTARTLSSNDTYKIIEMTSSSSITITIPSDTADSTFPIGSWIEVRQMGTGQITVSATSPATVVATDSQFKTRVRYSSVVLEKRASNAWYLAGDTTA